MQKQEYIITIDGVDPGRIVTSGGPLHARGLALREREAMGTPISLSRVTAQVVPSVYEVPVDPMEDLQCDSCQ